MGKKLAIITWDADSVEFYAKQIRYFFEDRIEVSTYSVQGGNTDCIAPADVYLVSTCAFSDRDLDQLIPPNSRVVLSEVVITRKSLARLLAVPRNTKALLVNINQPMANETIALFNQLGVTNIRFEPYYPGAPLNKNLHYAVTTGEPQLVPAGIKEVLDLGPRLLSGSTMTELAHYLKCESVLETREFRNYLVSLAERSYGIEQMLHRSIQLGSFFDLFQQALDSGVIGVDEDGSVFACSPKAADILGINGQELIGCMVQEKLSFLPFKECFAHRKVIHSRLVEIHGSPTMVSIQPVFHNNVLIGGFCILQSYRDEERRQQKARRQMLGKGHATKYTFESIVGESPSILAAKNLARKMAGSDASVLITGESGTGKELFAQAIHAASKRAKEPFIAINCAAIPDALMESQLFGYEEGAFTGAKKGGHIGFFEAACKGTLFLDEIEAMSPMLQVKLLRVLQEKEIIRLGGVDVNYVDVRIIAATNVDLATIVKEGGFRKDLYYRLCVLPLQLPPLRERPGDVLLLFDCIQKAQKAPYVLSPAAKQALVAHSWEGNVRELRNCAEYLAYLDKPVIEPEDLPPTITIRAEKGLAMAEASSGWTSGLAENLNWLEGKDSSLYTFILEELAQTPSMGRKALAAAAAEKGIFLTEQMIRTIMSDLGKKGLVRIHRGRSGTCITQQGRSILPVLKNRWYLG